mmetsp:Transcript_21141/g.2833  ORF Transcript_21141/g.2833 Transcript_21141/m.2833 type:complete len:82 (-) Transcript_21141:653-898(-)
MSSEPLNYIPVYHLFYSVKGSIFIFPFFFLVRSAQNISFQVDHNYLIYTPFNKVSNLDLFFNYNVIDHTFIRYIKSKNLLM